MTRLTVGQALVTFLTQQFVERDGDVGRFFTGCLGIFGHGNLPGIGQALLEAELADPHRFPYILGRNEQALVHTATAYARACDRLRTWAVTSSVGPGATNMVTGAATATINRLPVLLLPADTFATRVATPVLQELELPGSGDITVNDAFRPVSRYFDRVWRPEQLPSALLNATRVLTDPEQTGAATIAIPEDVGSQAYDWPDELFAPRVWHIERRAPDPDAVARAAALVRSANAPLIVAGGGVIYSRATQSLAAFAAVTGIPVAHTQAGTGAVDHDHPCAVGAIGATGTNAANTLAAQADLVIGIGTRFTDFTTASRTVFADPAVRFLTINVARMDAVKHGALPILADARAGIDALAAALGDHRAPERDIESLLAQWNSAVAATHGTNLTQQQIISVVNDAAGADGVVVCAAGSMPGDLHRLWRPRGANGYHVEYGYSCMGYEIAGGIGVKLAQPGREVFVLVGDGSYLMMSSDIVTAVQEGVKLVIVLVDNGGFASIGSLSESLGSGRFGTEYRYRSPSGRLDGDPLPVDLGANAASLGADVYTASTEADFRVALHAAIASPRLSVVHVRTDPAATAPDSESWWDVPVAEVAMLDSTRAARASYESARRAQRPYLAPAETP